MKNRFAVLLVFSLCLPLSARADDASQHAKAKELVEILHTDRMISQISGSIKTRINQAAERMSVANTSPENKTKLTDFEKKTSDMVDAQLNWTELEPQYIDIYAKTFTEPELDAIVGFYKSPAGTAFLAKTPDVNMKLNQLTQSRLEVLQGQINQALQEFRASQQSTPPASSTPPSLNTPAPKTPSTAPSTPSTPPSTSSTPK